MERRFDEIANSLTFNEGVYFTPLAASVSYPTEGHEACYQVEENSFWFNHRNKCIYHSVNQFLPKGHSFVDVGGGNGFVSAYLSQKGIDTILVEPGMDGCMNAKSRGVKQIICGTLKDVGFAPGSVDAFGLFDVLEHIPGDVEFIEQLNSLLAKDGLLILTVPAYKWLWSADDTLAGHFRRYTLRELIGLMPQAGFKVEYCTYFFSILIFPIWIFRTLPSKLGRTSNPLDTAKVATEHASKGIFSRLMQQFFSFELYFVQRRWQLPMGSSVMVVARKVS